jgi:hypothetical protein
MTAGDRLDDVSAPTSFDVIGESLKVQFETFLDEHRAALRACLDGLTEEQARRSLVASRTTLLGLVKHVTYVERVWFDEAVTGRSRDELALDDVLRGHRFGPMPLRWIYLHVLRELAQHCGHADILREQVLVAG